MIQVGRESLSVSASLTDARGTIALTQLNRLLMFNSEVVGYIKAANALLITIFARVSQKEGPLT